MLTDEVADRHSVPVDVARSLFAHAYRVGVRNLPDKQSAVQFTRNQLDRLGIGMEVERIPWGTKSPKLPPSKLTPQQKKSERLPKICFGAPDIKQDKCHVS